MPVPALIGAGAAGLAGLAAGASDKKTNSSSWLDFSSSQPSNEGFWNNFTMQNAQGLQGDFNRYQDSLTNGNVLPNQQQIGAAQSFANDIFAAQRTQLQQQFTQQNQDYSRQLAASGRGTYDPVFSAKMYEDQQRQSQLLAGQQTGYASQIALALPEQERALQAQALQNRAALLGLGSQMLGQERNWRVQTATQMGQQVQPGSFAGALSGGLTGALGGATAGLGIAGGISNMNLANTMNRYYTSQLPWGGNPTSGAGFMGPPAPYGGISGGAGAGFGGFGGFNRGPGMTMVP